MGNLKASIPVSKRDHSSVNLEIILIEKLHFTRRIEVSLLPVIALCALACTAWPRIVGKVAEMHRTVLRLAL